MQIRKPGDIQLLNTSDNINGSLLAQFDGVLWFRILVKKLQDVVGQPIFVRPILFQIQLLEYWVLQ